MAKALIFHNSTCLNCHKCEQNMIKVGPMVFCNDCWNSELVQKGMKVDENGDVNPFSKLYKKWIKKYKEFPLEIL